MATLFSKEFTTNDWSKIKNDFYCLAISSTDSGLVGNEFAAWVLVLSAGQYIYADGSFGNISFKCTTVVNGCVVLSNSPFSGKVIFTEGKSNDNPGNSYSVDYTGDEINLALGRLLGSQYGAMDDPGCHIIGKESSNPINLNTVDIPGMYTAYFYNHGPARLNIYNGTSPIRMHVYSDEDSNTGRKSVWQTIQALIYDEEDETTGQEEGEQLYLFFRNIWCEDSSEEEKALLDNESADYGWDKLKLSTSSTVIINNLRSDNTKVGLSANMGRYLKFLMDTDDFGSTNLIFNSNFKQGTTGWSADLYNTTTSCVKVIGPNDTSFKEKYDQLKKIENMHGRPSNGILITSKPLTTTNEVSYSGIHIHSLNFPILNGNEKYITASVYVIGEINGDKTPQIFAQLQLLNDNDHYVDGYVLSNENDFETSSDESNNYYVKKYYPYIKTVENVGNRIKRITVTLPRVDLLYTNKGARKIDFYFGIISDGVSKALFYHPQIEYGRHATSWHLGWYDIWYECDNARYINEIPISKDVNRDKIKNQQSIVYSSEELQFIAKYVATGGGGGFVAQADPPEQTELLWYCTRDNTENGYYMNNFYAYILGKWMQLSYKVIAAEESPNDKSTLWLNTSSTSYTNCKPYSATEPPDLMYYDTRYGNKWRPVGAARRPGFVIQRDPPSEENDDLMWIHPDTWIARVYYNEKWYPIQAIWGANNV